MHTLLQTTQEALRHHVDDAEVLNPEISAWSVGMHVEHCALAMAGMATKLAGSVGPQQSVLPAPPVKWSVPRVFITLTGTIPRGKGKAPKTVIPGTSPAKELLLTALETAQTRIEAAGVLPEEAWYDHHLFGCFRRDKVAVRDILK